MFTTLLLVAATLLGALSGNPAVFLLSAGLLLANSFPLLLLIAAVAGFTYLYR